MNISNVDRLKRKVAALSGSTRTGLMDALRTSGREINALQRQFAPKEDGVLVGTIDMIEDESLLKVTLVAGGPATTRPVRDGADAEYDYALAQELGTQKMPANPFFFPGYRFGKKRAKGRITRAINKAAKQAAGS